MQRQMLFNIGIGIYRKKDYGEILRISEDRDNMDDTWEEFIASRNKTKAHFRSTGMATVDILVKPKELVHYCRAKGLPINGNTRAQFIQEKTQELHT